jgi:hypothetical protein
MVEKTKVTLRTVDLRLGNHVEENISRDRVRRETVGLTVRRAGQMCLFRT